MSTSRFCHIYGLAIIFGLSVYSGSRAHGAIPNPTPPGARARVPGAWTAAAQTRALTFEIYQDKTNCCSLNPGASLDVRARSAPARQRERG